MPSPTDDRMFSELTLPEQIAAIAEMREMADGLRQQRPTSLATIAEYFANSAEAYMLEGKHAD